MTKNYEPKHIALAVAIVIAIFSLILIVFIPQTVADIVHYSTGVWQVFVPKENLIVYGIGFFLLFLAPLFLFFMNMNKRGIYICIASILLSFIPFYMASQSYLIFSNDSITQSPILSTKVSNYSWNEVQSVTFYEAEEGERSKYEFIFQDGHLIALEDNAYFQSILSKLENKLTEVKLSIERVMLDHHQE
ncbi:hypothetical protein J2Z40_000142 [Cytobacillus eiseniae]|uniref:YcxB-like protein domain-containing protein n=1 Tax=Cytobacillus eiseniae TaxID=762947 RepID=A0ABS4R9L4_9BACI|nr:hypothetical protein [Cytobacillus eiseniae]MBP2239589.1 hypothetical protein [Cytobacillus eiseniae]